MSSPTPITDEERSRGARALLICMEAISEDRYAAGWYRGIERTLWQEVKDGTGDGPMLGTLAALGGVWWVWDGGPKAVPLQEWSAEHGAMPKASAS